MHTQNAGNSLSVLNEQYNSIFSTPDPTMIIKYPKDFFVHPQENTLSDINITREDIIIIIIYHDFLPTPRRGSHVKSGKTHTQSSRYTP